MKRNMLIMAMLLAIPLVAQAQEAKLEVKPSGRILFDAAYLNPQHNEDNMKSGVGIPDVRVGVGFSYGCGACRISRLSCCRRGIAC